jgi:hypothetical protein
MLEGRLPGVRQRWQKERLTVEAAAAFVVARTQIAGNLPDRGAISLEPGAFRAASTDPSDHSPRSMLKKSLLLLDFDVKEVVLVFVSGVADASRSRPADLSPAPSDELQPQGDRAQHPGLSSHTYRKVIQRANARVLEAFERIRGGERCEEMRAGLLHRYIAEECSEPERHAIEAHFAHCRACRREQARMRGFLSDVAGALLAAATFAEPSRSVRERARDVLLRIAARLPGQGGEAVAGQALSASTLKVACVCVGVTASACLATGIVPGVGGVGLLSKQGHTGEPPTRHASQLPAPARRPTLIDTLPKPDTVKSERTHSQGGETLEPLRDRPQPSSAPAQPTYSTSEAVISGRQVGTEMGAESAGRPLPERPASAPAPSSGESGSERSTGSRPSSGGTTSSEFGM